MSAFPQFGWSFRNSDPPGLFLAWRTMGGGTACDLAPLVELLGVELPVVPASSAAALLAAAESAERSGVLVLCDCLSRLNGVERTRLNAARDRLLGFEVRVLLVEDKSQRAALSREMPDLMSVVRESVDLDPVLLDGDYCVGDTGASSSSLDGVVASLPAVLVRGSSVMIGGRIHRKAEPAVRCPRCGSVLLPGEVTMEFLFAPSDSRRQRVPGLVCPCGMYQVSGEVAREAHARAYVRVDRASA